MESKKVINILIPIYWFRYLAVVTALASEADFVFIPEAPPSVDWSAKLCDKLEQASFYIYIRLAPLHSLDFCIILASVVMIPIYVPFHNWYFFSFLAVYTALCTDATYSFICEEPAPLNWDVKLCSKIAEARI